MFVALRNLPIFVLLMGACALAMWIPATFAVVADDNATARSFFYSGLIWLLLTGLVAIVTSNYPASVSPRSNLLAFVLAYLVLPLMATLPVLEAVPNTSFGNVWFEMVSCFTTTGASVYDVPGRLPDAVHLWRGIVGWSGGLFILVAVVAVLTPMNLGGIELIVGKSSARTWASSSQAMQVADVAERVRRSAMTVFPAYLGLTVLLWIGLIMLGSSADTALIFAMGVLSSSGIAPGPGFTAIPGGFAAELLLFAFLWVAVTRSAVPGLALPGKTARLRDDPQIRLAAVIITLTACLIMLQNVGRGDGSLPLADMVSGFWAALFTALSYLTTTGYHAAGWAEVADWQGMGTPGLLLTGLVIMGGGVATTAGGVKLLRIYSLLRQGEQELVRLIYPNAVIGGGQAARRLRQEGAYLAWLFFTVFALTLATVIALLTLVGVAFVDALVLAVAALTNTGPLAASAGAEPLSYSDQSAAAQAILAITMVIGRVETLAILVLFARDSWKR